MFCARGLELETNLTFLDYISFLLDIKMFSAQCEEPKQEENIERENWGKLQSKF